VIEYWRNSRIGNLKVYTPEEFRNMRNGHQKVSDHLGDTRWSETFSDIVLPAKSLREIVEEAGEKTNWIVFNILATGEHTLLDGLAKFSGKTTFVMHCLKAVRAGEPFLGEATRRARILYLCEQGNNFREAIEDAGLDLDDEGFKVVQWRDVSDIAWPRLITAAVNMCKAEDRGILVCDTFAAFSGIAGTEENNSGDIKQKMAPLKRAAEVAGLAVLTTRHSGKDGRGRGSSQFEAEADVLISLRPKDSQGSESVRELEIIGRHGRHRMNIDKTPDGYDDLGSDNRVAFVKAIRTLKSVLPTKDTDALPEPDVLDLAVTKGDKLTRTTGRRALEWLVEQGDVARVGEGKRGNPFKYHLLTDGENPDEKFLTNGQSLSGQKETMGVSEPEDTDQDAAEESVPHAYVSDPDGLGDVSKWLSSADAIGIDIETTGLEIGDSEISLIQLSDGETTFVLDAVLIPHTAMKDVIERLPSKTLIAHNADFEKKFLSAAYGLDLAIEDTQMLAKVLEQGSHPTMHTNSYSLEALVERYLNDTLDKAHQKSNWSIRPLTDEQLAYAAKDAAILPPLYEILQDGIQEEGLAEVLDIERRAAPAFRWMEDTGVLIDRGRLETYIAEVAREADDLHAELKRFADINWGSSQQLAKLLGLADIKGWPTTPTGAPCTGANFLKRLKDRPEVATYLKWTVTQKTLSTYGEKWIARITEAGRIHARYDLLGTVTGRTSCTSPNMQNLPRDTPHKQCVVAPEGRVIVKSDYSQIELRIAAKLVPDENLMDIYTSGDVDVHTKMAATITGKPESEVTKEERNAAKAANFGPLYGMGAPGLKANAKNKYGVEWTLKEAQNVLKTFKESYPSIAAWHKTGYKPSKTNREELAPTRTMAGRRRRRFKSVMDWFNSPIQGTGADGAKLAMAMLYERRDEVPSMAPIVFVHDEIVIECDRSDVEAAKALLVRCMRDGMDAVLNKNEPHMPVEVEAKHGDSWG